MYFNRHVTGYLKLGGQLNTLPNHQLCHCFSLNAQFEIQILNEHLGLASERGGQGGCKLGVLEVVVYVWIPDLYYLVSNSQMVSGIPNQSVTRLSIFWVKFREMVKINFLAWNNKNYQKISM